MSRTEMYPWSLLTEVGDYFAVPYEFKPFPYMSALVAQRNYRMGSNVKYTAAKTTYGTIVMVSQVGDEKPQYEYLTPEGIMAITGKRAIMAQGPDTPVGERATVAKRTVSQIVNQMSVEMKQANLPWWYDPKNGQLIFNPKVATPEDIDKWYNKQKMPGKDAPYPDYYHLDENLQRKSSAQIAAEEPDEDDFFELLNEEQPE